MIIHVYSQSLYFSSLNFGSFHQAKKVFYTRNKLFCYYLVCVLMQYDNFRYDHLDGGCKIFGIENCIVKQ